MSNAIAFLFQTKWCLYIELLRILGLVLGTLYVGGYLMSVKEVSAGDLMSFMVATQTIQRFSLPLLC